MGAVGAWGPYQGLGRGKCEPLVWGGSPRLWLGRVRSRSFLSLLSWLRVEGGVDRATLLAQFLGWL